MSDYNPFVEEGEPSPLEGGPEIDLGGATEDGQTTDQPAYEESPKAYLDLDDDVANRYVRVKVDGEDLEVPLKEALQGYSRTADYTRKTQDLATQRQQAEYALAVQRALQAQPEETLRILSRQYGVNVEQSPPPGQRGWEQPSPYDEGPIETDEFGDPLERRINQLQQTVEQMTVAEQQRQADGVLRAAIGGLQQKYQLDDATTREVVGIALQRRMGPDSFEMIYKTLAFDRAQQARAQAQQQRQTTEAQRQAAGARANQLIGNGGSANGAGGRNPGASEGPVSIQQAFDAAWNDHVGG